MCVAGLIVVANLAPVTLHMPCHRRALASAAASVMHQPLCLICLLSAADAHFTYNYQVSRRGL